MRPILFTAIFLLTAFSCANAQMIIREAKDTAFNESAGDSSSVQINKNTFPVPQATPTATPAPAANSTGWYVRPTAKKRFNRYVMGMVGPVALAKTVVRAGYSTWTNSPEEWGDHWEGFGRRVASGFGKNVIESTVTYGLDETFKLDSGYYRSRKKDFKSKMSNALLSTVTARDTSGKRVFGFPHIAGTYAGHIIAAEAWYPDRFNYKDGLKSGTISLGISAAFNVFKEFVWKK